MAIPRATLLLLRAWFVPRCRLAAENLALRRQLAVLTHSGSRTARCNEMAQRRDATSPRKRWFSGRRICRDWAWFGGTGFQLSNPPGRGSGGVHASASLKGRYLGRPRKGSRVERWRGGVGALTRRALSGKACSAFTHIPACMVAKSPKVTRYTRVLQHIRYLLRRSDCFRPSDRLAGWDSHPLEIADFSRHTEYLGLAAPWKSHRAAPYGFPYPDTGRRNTESDTLPAPSFSSSFCHPTYNMVAGLVSGGKATAVHPPF